MATRQGSVLPHDGAFLSLNGQPPSDGIKI